MRDYRSGSSWNRYVVTAVAALLFQSLTYADTVVYTNDFESAVGAEWSNPSLDVTPSGRGFLGQFVSETVTLSLSGLPSHILVTVEFDLFIINTWDGNPGSSAGIPDSWEIALGGGPSIFKTTFSNTDTNPQSYPDPFLLGSHLRYTGASEVNTLGYTTTSFGSSVYELSFTFPHSASASSLDFIVSLTTGFAPSPVTNESWGLDNVTVSTSPIPEPSTLYLLALAVGAAAVWRRCRAGKSPSNSMRAVPAIAYAFLFLTASTATAEPVSFVLDMGGVPSSAILVNGSPAPVPQGLMFLINVDTTTTDTWGPTDFGLFPATSVFLTAPDLGFWNVLITTPLAYIEDDSPNERAGISPLFPDSGADVSLPTAGNTEIGNPNAIDTLPSLFGDGVISGISNPLTLTLETGHVLVMRSNSLPMGSNQFGPSSLTPHQAPVPEPSAFVLFLAAAVSLFVRHRPRRKSPRHGLSGLDDVRPR